MFNINNNQFNDFTLQGKTIKLFKYKQKLKANPIIVRKSVEEDVSGEWENELLETPEKYLKFDGEVFDGNYLEAIKYINNPNQYLANKNREKLESEDYKTLKNAANILIQLLSNPELKKLIPKEILEEFEAVESKKQEWRDEINRLETLS